MSALLFRLPRLGYIGLAQSIEAHWVVVQHFACEFVCQFFACFQVEQVAAGSQAFGGKLRVDTLKSLVDITSGDGARDNPMN